MCWVCERLENLIAGWNEEQEFQKQTSSDDYHRGLSKGFSECVRDLSEAVASMRLKRVCEKFSVLERSLDDNQRLDILNDVLKLGVEDSNQK
jgi:phage portal protein BeeE